jgi:hypothetical protein
MVGEVEDVQEKSGNKGSRQATEFVTLILFPDPKVGSTGWGVGGGRVGGQGQERVGGVALKQGGGNCTHLIDRCEGRRKEG